MTKGFTLMEAVVAIFVIITGIVGVMTLVTYTITSAQISKDKLIAAYLAQEGIEIVRNIRDTNWLEQYSESTNPWNEGLIGCDCTCEDGAFEGCIADYNTPTLEDPTLQIYNGEYLNIDSSGFYSYSTNPPFRPTKFRRKIVIIPEVYTLEVCARVEWEEKGIVHHIIVNEILYNWR